MSGMYVYRTTLMRVVVWNCSPVMRRKYVPLLRPSAPGCTVALHLVGRHRAVVDRRNAPPKHVVDLHPHVLLLIDSALNGQLALHLECPQ